MKDFILFRGSKKISEIDTEVNSESKDSDISEPTRGSVVILVIQLITVLAFTDFIYVIINYFLMRMYFLQTSSPFDLHKYVILILALLHIGKSFFQILLSIKIVMGWLGRSYFIIGKHLVKREGIFTVAEKICDLDNVRSITVNQSTLGRLLHYGDVVVDTSASGGYIDQITLMGVADPRKFEYKIRHSF